MENDQSFESTSGPDRDRDLPPIEELLGALPPPKEAAGLITALLADESRQRILESLSRAEPLDATTARLIAYNLVAHAPDSAETARLYDFFLTGYGDHAALRAEYLPLARDTRMPADGRLLLDTLGTFLFERDHPQARPKRDQRLGSAVVVGTDRSGMDTALAFAYTTSPTDNSIREQATHLLNLCHQEGDGLRAFLRVPGVDGLSRTLLSDFREAWIGSVSDDPRDDALLDDLSPLSFAAVEVDGTVHLFLRDGAIRRSTK